MDLRKRLERAWTKGGAAPETRPETKPIAKDRLTLDDVVAGTELCTDSGVTYVRDWHYSLEHVHGRHPLRRFVELQSQLPGRRDPFGIAGDLQDLRAAAFLDTETTGLAGGTGTYVILVGIGRFDQRGFTVRQFFLRDYHEEAALLRGVQDELGGCSGLVSFNGRTFDVPLLATRFTLLGSRPPGVLEAHWDLLHSARRVYSWQLESCALSALEHSVLQFDRSGDVPGAEIPLRYFSYLREQDAAYLEGICEHNRDDILSLVSLSTTLLELAADPQRYHSSPQDLVGLGRSFELEGQLKRAAELYSEGLAGLDGEETPACNRVRLRLARVLKRMGRYAEAAEQWENVLRSARPPLEPYIELAKHYEHRLAHCDRALELVDEALGSSPAHHDREDLLHRRRRLVRKLRAGHAE